MLHTQWDIHNGILHGTQLHQLVDIVDVVHSTQYLLINQFVNLVDIIKVCSMI